MAGLKDSLDALLEETEKSFLLAGIDSAKREAWWLFRDLLPEWSGIKGTEKKLSVLEQKRIKEAVSRRIKREPLAYISGEKGFWNDSFKVDKSTLIPRADSEALIELFLKMVPDKNISASILDLGTGTGCLLLSILSERIKMFGIGTDIVPNAIFLAQENAKNLDLLERSEFVVSDWGRGIERQFNFIISNPPYIKTTDIKSLMPEVALFEPSSALDGGKDGLDCYKLILERARKMLLPEGKIFFEIGEGQGREVCTIAESLGFSLLGQQDDLTGKERALVFCCQKK
ncbi:peptide chain release factor N(5)-glutamine methyltransferase [Acetobacteraceae bacterium]|nr:peptide chain release factor N(5)-glutamine methyltransferase [Acetobacteraceae bacterium]